MIMIVNLISAILYVMILFNLEVDCRQTIYKLDVSCSGTHTGSVTPESMCCSDMESGVFYEGSCGGYYLIACNEGTEFGFCRFGQFRSVTCIKYKNIEFQQDIDTLGRLSCLMYLSETEKVYNQGESIRQDTYDNDVIQDPYIPTTDPPTPSISPEDDSVGVGTDSSHDGNNAQFEGTNKWEIIRAVTSIVGALLL